MLIDDFAKLNRSSRNSIFIALTAIGLVAIYNWLVVPHTNYLFAAQRYNSITDDISKKSQIVSNAIEIGNKKLEELQAEFVRFDDVLFTADEAKSFISDLQAISEQSGCTIASLVNESGSARKQSGDTSSDIVTNNLMLSVVGAYNDIIRLVEKLQSYKHKIWIDSLEMELIEDDAPKLKCDLTVTLYVTVNKELI